MRKELLEFMDQRDSFEVRGTRILLEYFYANEMFRDFNTSGVHGISVFGSARVKEGTKAYEDARKIGDLLYQSGFAVITGASGGVMEAANRGVSEAAVRSLQKKFRKKTEDQIRSSEEYKDLIKDFSIGLKITLPFEKDANPFLGTWVSFHYFAIRKLFFAMLSEGFIRCDGGWGTRDEFWEVATLVQTGKTPLMPIVVYSSDGQALLHEIEEGIEGGYISSEDRYLVDVVNSAEEAIDVIKNFYKNLKRVRYTRDWEIWLDIRKAVPRKNRLSMNNYLKKNPGVFGDLLFSSEKVLVRGYSFQSFGHLRRLINALNGVEEF